MDYPRRSQRLSRHTNSTSQEPQTSVPALGRRSQTSSTTTTSYPSPTDDSESDSTQLARHLRYTPNLNFQSSMSQPHLNAPLPSPSTGDTEPFFGRPHPQVNPYQIPHSQHRQQQHQQAPSHQAANQNPHPHHNSISQKNNNFSQPAALPADFLAEAAKRAQMACLMRDLGDVSL